MTERRKLDIRGAIVSSAISAIVTLLVVMVTFASTFGGVNEKVQQIAKDVDSLVTTADSQRSQVSFLCERIASLEAQVRIYQNGKGG